MTTNEIRKVVKTAAPTAKIAKYGDTTWTARVTRFSELDQAVLALEAAGFVVSRRKNGKLQIEIEGSRWAPEWVITFSVGLS